MSNCYQTKGQTILQHGLSVWEHTKKIISGEWDDMRIPDWMTENHDKIVGNLYPIKDVKSYNIYHDCGKPFCEVVDEKGKHFPDHAKISKDIYFQLTKNGIVSDLIVSDMYLHTCTAEQLLNDLTDSHHQYDIEYWMTLLVTGLAEIHSNAKMFGGIDSDSFKMKWKKLNQRGKVIINHFFKEIPHTYNYVIVRDDLTDSQKAVQGTHAALNISQWQGINHYSVIYLKVRNELKLKRLIKDLLEQEVDLCIFREKNMNNEITAICTQSLIGESRKVLKKYQLL